MNVVVLNETGFKQDIEKLSGNSYNNFVMKKFRYYLVGGMYYDLRRISKES